LPSLLPSHEPPCVIAVSPQLDAPVEVHLSAVPSSPMSLAVSSTEMQPSNRTQSLSGDVVVVVSRSHAPPSLAHTCSSSSSSLSPAFSTIDISLPPSK
jgi:hypothetical protein